MLKRIVDRITLGTRTPEGKIIAVLLTIVLATMAWSPMAIASAFADQPNGATEVEQVEGDAQSGDESSGDTSTLQSSDDASDAQAAASDEGGSSAAQGSDDEAADGSSSATDEGASGSGEGSASDSGNANQPDSNNGSAVNEDGDEADGTATAMPALSVTDEANGITVTVNAPAGALPEGTQVSVTANNDEANAAIAAEAAKGTVLDTKAVDLTFTDADGDAVTPEAAMTLEVSGTSDAAGTYYYVLIDADGTQYAASGDATATFESSNPATIAMAVAEDSADDQAADAEAAPAEQLRGASPIVVTADGDEEPEQLATVSFYKDDGTSLVSSVELVVGATIGDALPVAPESTISGFEFVRWANTADGTTVTEETVVPEEGMTVKAVSESIEYVVNFYDKEGNLIEQRTYAKTDAETLGSLPSAPTVEGSLFQGYETSDGTAVTASTVVTGDMDLHATYKQMTEVVFLSDDGVEVISKLSAEAGGQVGTLPQHPSKEGYLFDKWVLQSDPSVEVTASTFVPEGGLTAIAQFKPIEIYSITANYYYVVNGNRVDFDSEVYQVDGENLPYTINAPGSTMVDEQYIPEQPTYYPSTPTITVTKDDFDEGSYALTVEVEYVSHTAVYDFVYLLADLDGEGYTEIERESNIEGVLGSTVTPTVKNYDYAEVESIETAQITQASGQELAVKYQRKDYTLTYDVDGGSYVASVNAPYGSQVAVAGNNATERTGYVFDGWYLDPELTQPAGSTVKLNADTTLHAKWRGANVPYTIVYMFEKYDNATGTTSYVYDRSNTRTAETGSTVTAANAPRLTNNINGYEYDTTKNATSQVTVAADGTSVLTVYYSLIRYTINFSHRLNYGGYNYSAASLTVGGTTYTNNTYTISNAVIGQDLSNLWPTTVNSGRNNYEFTGWRYDTGNNTTVRASKVTELTYDLVERGGNSHAVTFYARYQSGVSTQALEYWLQQPDGTYVKSDDLSQLVHSNGNFGEKDVEGYTYYDGVPSGYSGTENGYYTYEQEVPAFDDVYTFNGGDDYEVGDPYYRNGHTYTITSKERRAWYIVINPYAYTAECHEPAHTEEVTEYIKINRFYYDRAANDLIFKDGTTTLKTVEDVLFEADITDEEYTPAKPSGKEDFTWGGWYEDAGLTTPYTFSTMPSHELVVYAKWIAPQYTVSFNSNGGTPTFDSVTVDKYGTVDYPGQPTRENYEFAGWYTAAEGGDLYDWNNQVTEDIELFAHWKQKTLTYTVHYFEAGTANKVLPDKVITDPALTIGQQITEQAASVSGYRADAPSKSLELAFDDANNVITFYYSPRTGTTSYTVKYVKHDDPSVEVHAPKTVTGIDSTQISVVEEAVAVDDMYPLEDVKILTLSSDADANVIVFEYSEFQTLKASVKFVDMDGNTIPSPYAGQSFEKLGATYQINTTAPNGYVLYGVSNNIGTSDTVYQVNDGLINQCGEDGLVITVQCQKHLTIQAKNKNKIYDGTALVSEGLGDITYEGLASDHSLTGISYTGSQTNVGSSATKPHDAVITGPASDNYYYISYKTGSLTVKPVEVLISIEPDRWNDGPAYDGTDRTIGFRHLVTGGTDGCDINNATYDAQYGADIRSQLAAISLTQKDAGFYTIPVSQIRSTLQLPDDDNYHVTLNIRQGELTIAPKPVIVTTGGGTKAYDGTALTNSDASIEGIITGESATVTASGSQTEPGSSTNGYSIEWGTGTKATNYIITENLGTLEVTAAEVTATVADLTLPYNGKTQYGNYEITFSGLASGHTAYLDYEPANGINAGTYNNGTFDRSSFRVVSGTNVDVTNFYTLGTTTAGKLTISPAEFTVEDLGDVVYNGQSQKQEPVVKFGDTVLTKDTDYTLSYSADTTNVGTVTVTVTGTENGNFAGATGTATYQITPKDVTITVADAEKTYGENDPAFSGTVTGLVNGESLSNLTYSRTNTAENVGTYEGVLTATFDANTNYNVTVTNGTFTIKPATFTVDELGDVTYNGESQKQKPAVKFGETTLVEDTDYELAWSDDTTNVGTVTVTVTGKGNFEGATGTATYQITPKPVTINVAAASKVYGASDPTFTGTVTGLVNDDDLGEIAYSRTNTDENVGTYPDVLDATYTANANYSVTVNKGTFTITTATFTVEDLGDVVYNGQSQKQEPVVKFGDTVLAKDTDYTLSYSADTTNVGTVTVTVAGKGNFSGETPVTYQITPKPVTVTPNDASKTYGASDPALTATVDGVVGSDTIEYSTPTRDAGEDVGAYAIHVTGSANQGNYTVTFGEGTFTINPATFTVEELGNVTYNGQSQEQEPAVKFGESTLVEGTDYELAWSEDTTNVGTVTVTVTGKGNFTGVQTVTYEILPATVTVTPDNASKTYGEDDPTLTAAVSGLQGSDAESLISYTLSRDEGENVGTYVIHAVGNEKQGNYTVEFKTGTFTINPAAVTITVTDASKAYGDPDPAFTGTVEGLVHEGDLGTISYFRTNAEVENVGVYEEVLNAMYAPNANYTVTVVKGDFTIGAVDFTVEALANVTYDGAAHAQKPTVKFGETTLVEGTDYELAWSEDTTNVGTVTVTVTGKGNFTGVHAVTYEIVPAEVTITVADSSKTYGDDDPDFTGTVEGLVHEGDLGTITYVRTNSAVETVGNYPDVLTAEYTVNKNYNVTVVNGDFAITPKAVTITVDDASKVYGDSDPAFTGTVEGLINDGDLGTITYKRTNTDENVGTYTGVLTAEWSKTNNNYNVTIEVGDFTITAKSVTITVADSSKTYGDDDPAFTGTVEGLVHEGDLGTISYFRTNAEVENVGVYEEVLNAMYAPNANYTVTVVKGDFTISKRTVTVTPDNVSKAYGTSDPALTATVDGVVGSDTVEYSLARETGEDAGTYKITASGETEQGNYTVTFGEGTFTINPIGFRPNKPNDVFYNGQEQKQSITVIGSDGKTLVEDTDFTVAYSGDLVNVGTVEFTVTGKGNYSGTVTGHYKIMPAKVTITVDDSSKTYGNPDPTFTGEVEGLVSDGDLGTIAYIRTNAEVNDAGTYEEVLDATYTANANYSVTVVKGDFTINKAKVDVPTAVEGLVYNGTEQTGVKAGDLYTVTDGTGTNAGDYTATATLTDPDNYEWNVTEPTSDPQTIEWSIAKAQATITVADSSKTYGDNDPAFTGTVTGLVNASDLGDITYSRTNTAEAVGTYPDVLDATYQENSNYDVTVVKGDFEIKTASASSFDVTAPEDVTYNGQSQQEKPTVKFGDITLTEGTDYELAWSEDTTNVGTVTVTVTGKGNFEGTKTVTYKITPKAVTITVADAEKTYGDDDPAFTGEVEGLVNDGDLGDITYKRTNAAVEAVGNYTDVLTAEYTVNKNYNVTVVDGDFEIKAADVSSDSFEVTDPDNVTYNGQSQQEKPTVTFTKADGTEVELAEGTDYELAWSEDTTNVGTVTVTITGKGNFTGTTTATYKITPKAATVTVADAEKTYGDDDPAFTGEVDGLVAGDSLANLNYERTNTAENVGIYPEVLNATFDENPNYDVTVVKGDFEIKPASASSFDVTAPEDVVYNGQSQQEKPTVKFGETTLTEGTDYELAWSDDTTNVGTVTVTVTGKGNFSGAKEVTYKITPKAATVTVADAEKTYGDNDPAFTGTVEGLVGTDTLANLEYVRTNATENNVGTYDDVLTATFTVNKNYEVTVVNGDFKINKKAVTITVANASKTYGDNDPAFTGTVEGLVDDGDLGTIAYVRTNAEVNDAGTYEEVLDATFTANDNYEVTVVKGDFTINKKAVTIVVNDSNKTYGDDDPAFTGTVTGLVSDGDLGEIKYVRTNADVNDAGTYREVLDAEYTANDNYTVSVTKGTFTINTAEFEVGTLDDVTYNGKEQAQKPAVTFKGNDLTEGTDYELAWSDDTTNVGTVTVTITGKGNFGGSTATVTYKILPAEIELPTAAENLTYNGSEQTGVADGDNYSVTDGAKTNAGNYTATVKLDDPDNYVWKLADGSTTTDPQEIEWSIAKKTATVTVADAEKTYGDNDPAFTGEIDGLVAGDSLANLKYERTNTAENVGIYPEALNATFDENPNYDVTVTKGDFEIKPADVSSDSFEVTDPDNVTYNGKPQQEKPTVTFTKADGTVVDLTEGTDYTLSYSDDTTNAGTVTVTITGKGNFTGTTTATYKITPKEATITVLNSGKIYGEEDPEFEGRVEGLINDDDLGEITYIRTNKEENNAGTYPDVLTATYEENANYDVTVVNGHFFIRKKLLDIPTAPEDLTYNGTKQDGIEPNSLYEVVGGSGTNAGRYVARLELFDYANYGWNRGDGTEEPSSWILVDWSIAPAKATVTANDASKTYGEDDPELTATVSGLFGSDTVEYNLARKTGEAVGTYAIQASGDEDQGNYIVTFVDGTFTITAAPEPEPTPTPTPKPKTTPSATSTTIASTTTAAVTETTEAEITEEAAPEVKTTGADETAPETQTTWALIDLLLSLATAIMAVVMLVGAFGRNREDEEGADTNRHSGLRIASLIPAIGAVALFLATQDLSGLMTLVDNWTIAFAAIALVQVGLGVASSKGKDDGQAADNA